MREGSPHRRDGDAPRGSKGKRQVLTEGCYSISVLLMLQRNQLIVFLFMKVTFGGFDPISLPLQNKTALFGILSSAKLF